MWWKRKLGLGLALLLGGAVTAQAQNNSSIAVKPVPAAEPAPAVVAHGASPTVPGVTLKPIPEMIPVQYEGPSRLEESGMTDVGVGQEEAPKLGPAMPEDVKILMNTDLGERLEERGARIYGWLNFGYTYSSTGPGILNVEPRENRFGNEFSVNQFALVLEKPLKTDEDLSWGYKALPYAGADAALLRPRGGFTTFDPRFGFDFRELYGSAHLGILSDGGVDVKAGRMGTIIGYESAMAPYRPFYSNDYQWFYSQDGAWTGALTNWHVNSQLDVLNGITLGANTFFTLRGTGPCYIGQVNWWTSEEKKTMLSASLHIGNQAIFAATPAGNVTTMWELRAQHNWNEYLTQIIQSDNGWETGIPGVGTGDWYSLYSIMIFHLNERLDLNARAEWFSDNQGTRTGFKASYESVTLGVDYHPVPWMRWRPELRGDLADHKVFGQNGIGRDNAQLTAAVECLLQY